MMKNLAIIPARGGSKRIPRKNIKDFRGKPIIAYSIEAAIRSELFDTIMVSTDDEEVADVARKFGAEVPFLRSAQNSDDHAGLISVFCEVLDFYKAKGQLFSHCCGILSTAPLLRKEHLTESFSLLNEQVRAVIPIVEYDFPIQRHLVIENGFLNVGDKESYVKRSQDLPERFHDAGQFYWAECEGLLKEKGLYKLNPKPYRLNKNYFQDIDTPEDWERVEMIYNFLYESGISRKTLLSKI